MASTIFSAIDVGSNEVSMKIYELSKKDGIRELDHVRHTIELGADTYRIGKISHSLVDELCSILVGFRQKMKEYDVKSYNAYATSAIREAKNYLSILDQIQLKSGLKVKILSNSEQRFLLHKAVAMKENDFNNIIKKGTAIVDVGAGSVQISLFDEGHMITTQNIKLGSLRIRELLSDLEYQTLDYNNLISEYIDNDLNTFHELCLQYVPVSHIIGIGENLTEFIRNSFETYFVHHILPNSTNSMDSKTTDLSFDRIDHNDFSLFFHHLETTSIDRISESLGIPREQAALIVPTAMIYYKIFDITHAQFMWLPGSTLCDGIVADYAENKEKMLLSHPFTKDILWSARFIAAKYHSNQDHINFVETKALYLFDMLKKFHGLSKRERLILQISCILHSCGSFINMNFSSENTYNIIMASEIIGLSHSERVMVATLTRYSSEYNLAQSENKNPISKDSYIKMLKLAAILQLANVLDKSHQQKCDELKIVFSNKEMFIYAKTQKDITLEKGLVEKTAYFFEEIYGIHPVLKTKKERLI